MEPILMISKRIQFTAFTLGASFVVVSLMVAASGEAAKKPATLAAVSSEPVWTESPAPPSSSGRASDLKFPGGVVVPSFADIVEQANPAVVNITATEIIESGERRRSGRFEFFFPDPRRDRDPRDNREREDHGGSGFIISKDGYILTNHHVIEDADRVSVRLMGDSREYQAEKIGSDPDTDLALLRIVADRDLPLIPLGDSGTLRVGDWVLAIGNPLAYEHTVTVGVVSAKGRKLWAMGRDPSLDNFIQTDAAINRGNSGGPLLNTRGEAVGINSAISVAGQGISFAIPVNMAKQVVSQLLSTGKITRGALGVQIRDISRELDPDKREYFKLQGHTGAFVEAVTEGLPAAEAGLQPGDAIVSVDGHSLDSSDELIRRISSKPPGEKVTIGVLRDGKEMTITTVLADRTELARNPGQPSRRPEDGEENPPETRFAKTLGFTVHELNPTLRRQFRIDREVEGLVIVHVDQTSPAWEKGLREGNIIVEVNRQAVADMDSFEEVVGGLEEGDLVNLYVGAQTNNPRFITLRRGSRKPQTSDCPV
jgi:serine protease Do